MVASVLRPRLPLLRPAGCQHPVLRHGAPHCLVDPPSLLLAADAVVSLDPAGLMTTVDPSGVITPMDAAAVAADLEAEETVTLSTLGTDLFIFLAASVLVVPASRLLNVTPVLGFLALGCAIGPYGLGLFSDTEADIELGDFGILFLLFIEGLNLSPARLNKLGTFFQLGVAQVLLSIGFIFASTLLIGPQLLPSLERFIPLDDALLRPVLSSPVEAFAIAAAGALSSSAFVLPVLKQKGWESRADGTAALAVLLLQDLAVAPLLIILQLSGGNTDQTELGILVAKATFGFGAVVAAGSVILRQIFNVVAASKSTETFVAAALLVAVGMGAAAEQLGLSSSTGAFAAGVLLAGSQYRAQIEADIKPFEGILLGVFFMTAGANLDPALCVREWPTLMTGVVAFIGVKAAVLFAAGELALGLTRGEASRIALLLAGGGEFAFVLFKLAEDLGLLPDTLAKLLTASVIISMSLTPLLGEVAESVGNTFDAMERQSEAEEAADKLFDAIDTDGDGSISPEELRRHLLGGGAEVASAANSSFDELFAKLDLNDDGGISRDELRLGYQEVLMGEMKDSALLAESALLEESGGASTKKDAVVVCGYGELGQKVCDTLRSGFTASGGGDGGAGNDEFVAFDREPARISIGMVNQVRVVYGDGASSDLLRAAGVSEPRAIVVTYANPARCLEATRRLRDSFPAAPIYACARSVQEGEALSQAGATEVVIEPVEAAVRFSNLLGVESEQTDAKLRALPSLDEFLLLPEDALPFTQDEIEVLAQEAQTSTSEVIELYRVFRTLDANDDGEVGLDEIRDVLMRTSSTPIDDEALRGWMTVADADGGGKLSFDEFLRVYKSQEASAVV